MNHDIQNRYGESITREDESQILDTISKWLDRDVRDKVLDLEHADEYLGPFWRDHQSRIPRYGFTWLNLCKI